MLERLNILPQISLLSVPHLKLVLARDKWQAEHGIEVPSFMKYGEFLDQLLGC